MDRGRPPLGQLAARACYTAVLPEERAPGLPPARPDTTLPGKGSPVPRRRKPPRDDVFAWFRRPWEKPLSHADRMSRIRMSSTMTKDTVRPTAVALNIRQWPSKKTILLYQYVILLRLSFFFIASCSISVKKNSLYLFTMWTLKWTLRVRIAKDNTSPCKLLPYFSSE